MNSRREPSAGRASIGFGRGNEFRQGHLSGENNGGYDEALATGTQEVTETRSRNYSSEFRFEGVENSRSHFPKHNGKQAAILAKT